MRQLQLTAAQTVISNRIKADDTFVRQRQLDIMPRIIQMLKEEKAKLKLVEQT